MEKTIVIIGGGYAGLHLLNHLKSVFRQELGRQIRIILIDKNDYHFQKVLLVKAGISEETLKIPFSYYCNDGIEFIKDKLEHINSKEKKIKLEYSTISYDYLVIAIGSISREAPSEKGGISLSNLENARKVFQNLADWKRSSSKRCISIVGSGITGIETAAEIAGWCIQEGLNQHKVKLVNKEKRLLSTFPNKVSSRIEAELTKLGVSIIHQQEVDRFDNGQLIFKDGTQEQTDLVIWTIGLRANPLLKHLRLPTSEDGRIKVDEYYEVLETKNIYAIGDAAKIEMKSTLENTMTCKEAIAQAERLAKIIYADINGGMKTPHTPYPPMACIGLGPEQGLVWAQKWGIDFVIAGKLGKKVRDLTWKQASLL